ncbi:ladderlectin-like [Chaetodon trifascialis]|uniref:ladderlectin-like n=1 Tax=Chaetodon trifascialis TaxID=109706 RepID=UPI00399364BA
MKMMLTVTLLVCAMMALSSAAVPKAEPAERTEDPFKEMRDNPIVKRSTCPRGWTALNGRCLNYFATPKTWAEAEKHCLSLGGNLASVHSSQEYHDIQMTIWIRTHSYPQTWLGGYDVAQEGVWFWTDGTPKEFTYWSFGQPNRSGYCLVMNFGGLKRFDDQPCSLRRPFVCAKKP